MRQSTLESNNQDCNECPYTHEYQETIDNPTSHIEPGQVDKEVEDGEFYDINGQDIKYLSDICCLRLSVFTQSTRLARAAKLMTYFVIGI